MAVGLRSGVFGIGGRDFPELFILLFIIDSITIPLKFSPSKSGFLKHLGKL